MEIFCPSHQLGFEYILTIYCQQEILRGSETDTICVCEEGWEGDPDSEAGCAEPRAAPGSRDSAPPPSHCHASNSSYAPGASWYNRCEYRYSCSTTLEILCEARYKIITENVESPCRLVPDPEDYCCQAMLCPHRDSNTSHILQPSLGAETSSQTRRGVLSSATWCQTCSTS